MATLTHDHSHSLGKSRRSRFDLFAPFRHWLNQIEIHDSRLAHFLCQLIPCQCAFERDITLFGKTFHIPALCKLNPLYDELISLRFRALTYLAEVCGEDVERYIC